MTKFYEVPFDGEESSVYVVVGSGVALLWNGKLKRTLMTLHDCNELVRLKLATAHE